MKKLFGLLVGLLLGISSCFAACDTSMCAQPPYPVGGSISTTISNITGVNFILSKALEIAVEKELKNALGSKFDVEIYPYGGKNLIDGKFKKVTAKSKNLNINGLHISEVTAESLCDYNRFVLKDGKVFTAENFLFGYTATITSDDLQKTLLSPEYIKLLNSTTVSVNNFVMFKLFDPIAKIKNDRLYLSVKVISPLINAKGVKEISLNMGLAVNNGQIVFTDVKLNDNACANLNSLLPIINKINPFTFKTNIMDNRNSVVKVNDIYMTSDKIVIKGVVLTPKNYYND